MKGIYGWGLLLALLVPMASQAATPGLELIMTSGVSANLKPRNDLDKLPRGAGKFTVFMRWTDLPVKKKWMFINDSDPISYTTKVYDGQGALVGQDVHTFTPDKTDSVSWSLHEIKAEEKSGNWRVLVEVFGQRYQKTLQIYD